VITKRCIFWVTYIAPWPLVRKRTIATERPPGDIYSPLKLSGQLTFKGATTCTAIPQFHILRNPEVHCLIDRNHETVPILSQTISVPTTPSHHSKSPYPKSISVPTTPSHHSKSPYPKSDQSSSSHSIPSLQESLS
jgi:hypothetical protein